MFTLPKEAGDQTLELPEIWDVLTLMSRHYNDYRDSHVWVLSLTNTYISCDCCVAKPSENIIPPWTLFQRYVPESSTMFRT